MEEILVTIPVEPQHKKYLEDAAARVLGSGGSHFVYKAQKDVKQDMAEKADIILGNVEPEFLRNAADLKLMQLDSAGASPYIVPGIMPPGAKLANATGAYGLAISEYMLGAVLMLVKKLHLYERNMRAHAWQDEGKVNSIADSVTLVVGLGDIGGQFAQKMHALGSHVIGIRRNKAKKPDYLEELHQLDALDTLLERADIVACTLPGTPETEKLFCRERLEKMKDGAILLNVGRGSLIPSQDLCDALHSGKLGGAAIDVTEQEPLGPDSPLWDAPNLLITPHVAGKYHMQQILESIVEIAAYNLQAILTNGTIKNEVDFQTGYRKFYEPADKQEEERMTELTVKELYTLEETIAADIFDGVTYPWEVLPKISSFILELGKTLDEKEYEKRGENIWIARSAKVAPTAYINGPAIIGKEAEVRHCAFIRGNAIVGEGAVVGNSTELKNVILFNKVQVPHYNYVGDSILGYKSHMGAGSITSNVKSDKKLVLVKTPEGNIETGMKKFGAMLGDEVEVGCGSVLNPGTVVGSHSNIYPLSSVRGYVPGGSIYKKQGEVVEKIGI